MKSDRKPWFGKVQVFIEHIDGFGVYCAFLLLVVGGADQEMLWQGIVWSIGQGGRGEVLVVRTVIMERENFDSGSIM